MFDRVAACVVQVVVSLDAAAVPVLEGALQCACDGFRSSLHRDNATVAAVLEGGPDSLEAGLFAVLVDPQTGALPKPWHRLEVVNVSMHLPPRCSWRPAGFGPSGGGGALRGGPEERRLSPCGGCGADQCAALRQHCVPALGRVIC